MTTKGNRMCGGVRGAAMACFEGDWAGARTFWGNANKQGGGAAHNFWKNANEGEALSTFYLFFPRQKSMQF